MLPKLLQFLDGLCATWQSVQQNQSPEAFAGRGTVIPEGQVAVALSGQEPMSPWPEFTASFAQLSAELEVGQCGFSLLCRRLNLDGFGLFCLLLAIAPQWNRKYERVFAYLQDSVSLPFATVGLAADLYSLIATLDEEAIFAINDSSSTLNGFVLMNQGEGLSRPLRLQPTVLRALVGDRSLPRRLTNHCTLHWEACPPELVVRKKEGEDVLRYVRSSLERQGDLPSMLGLYGSEGSGRRYLLRYVAASLGIPMVCLDCRSLTDCSGEEREILLDSLKSWCWIHRALPVLCHFDAQRDWLARLPWLLQQMTTGLPLLALCGTQTLSFRIQANLVQLELEGCSMGEQRLLWEHVLQETKLPLAEDLDALTLASIYVLTPGQIQQALSDGTNDCLAKGESCISREDISYGIRQICRPKLRQLAESISPSFTWDDLMLEQAQMDQLQQMCNRIRYRWQVNEEWGFNRKLPYGRGVSVCLYGPPGTGKTMTAQVLAREFGLDAYRVDMSRIMDKYIGETEKKLSELFDAARDSNAILFFDEADVLFSKRSQVNDSKDKYANAETAYLLQRMEQHAGISILATNAVQNFDEAFKRRISFMIPISMPSPEIRKRLWHAVFPEDTPLQGVDLDFFAQRFEFSGSSIKRVAVDAAFRAVAEQSPITREILKQAVKEEFIKTGRVLMEHELH